MDSRLDEQKSQQSKIIHLYHTLFDIQLVLSGTPKPISGFLEVTDAEIHEALKNRQK